MRRRRIAKKRPPRGELVPLRDSVPESACDGDTGLDCNPPAHPTVSGRNGHAGMRGVRVWKDPHIRKDREMCGAPGICGLAPSRYTGCIGSFRATDGILGLTVYNP